MLWAKDGLNGTWFQEAGGVTDFAVSPTMLVIHQGSSILQGQGRTQRHLDDARGLDGRIVVSGNRLAVLTPGAVLWAKDGLNVVPGGRRRHRVRRQPTMLVIRQGSSILQAKGSAYGDGGWCGRTRRG